MLWLPTKDWQNEIIRRKRRQHRRRLVRGMLLLFLLFGLTTATVPPEHARSVQVNRATQGVQFGFIGWVVEAVASEVGRRAQLAFGLTQQSDSGEIVRAYVKREEQIGLLQGEISQAIAQHGTAPLETQQTLARLQAEQSDILPQIELTLARQVEQILQEEGFTMGQEVFPPVAFRLINPPTVLILSPRDRIERIDSLILRPGLTPTERFTIEAQIERAVDTSSYITDIGGLGSYPAMVIRHAYLPGLINIVIHEWVHNYLFLFPTNMAWGYNTHPRLRTINETTASLVGRELSYRVVARYYPEWVAHLPPLDELTGRQTIEPQPSPFQLQMRHIRQEVDRLLVAGQIETAEQFMAHQREQLVAAGHPLRRLNQAYFAFHGAYALSPTSVDPTGAQLQQLRAKRGSIKQFLDAVGWLNSYEGYQAWLAAEQVPATVSEYQQEGD